MPTDPRAEKAEALARDIATVVVAAWEVGSRAVPARGERARAAALPFATRLIEAEERIAAFEEAERLWVADFDSEHPEIIPTPEEKAAAERMVGVVRELIEQKKVEGVIRERDALRSRLHSLEEAAKLAKDALGRHSIVCYFEPNYCREEDQSHRCERCASRAALSSLSSALRER